METAKDRSTGYGTSSRPYQATHHGMATGTAYTYYAYPRV